MSAPGPWKMKIEDLDDEVAMGECKECLLRCERAKKHPDFAQNTSLQSQAMALDDKIGEIERAKLDSAAATSAARYKVKGEAVNKYWFSIGKSMNKEASIGGLVDDVGNLRTSTTAMLDIAAEYHGRLQACPDMTEARENAIAEMVTWPRARR